MAITVVGLLEADLPGAIEYKSGGIGPLFGEARTEEPLSLDEFLSRIVRVLRKAGLTSVVTVFIDETEAYVDEDAGDDNLDAALNITRDAIDLESGTSFYLMLTHEGDDLSHVITVEGSVDHPSEEAALSILDTARLVDGGGAAADDEEEEDDGEGRDEPLQPVEDDVTFFDDSAPEAQELVEAFLQRLLAELERELGVSEPEIDVWTDWEGEYDPSTRYPSSIPGTGV